MKYWKYAAFYDFLLFCGDAQNYKMGNSVTQNLFHTDSCFLFFVEIG